MESLNFGQTSSNESKDKKPTFERITESDPTTHERMLRHQASRIKLIYCQNIAEGKIKPLYQINKEILSDNESDKLALWVQELFDISTTEKDKETISRIRNIFESNPNNWIEEAANIIEENEHHQISSKNRIRENVTSFFIIMSHRDDNSKDKSVNHMGLFDVVYEKNFRDKDYEGANIVGDVLEIHVPPLFKQKKEGDVSTVFSGNTFGKIAEYIVDQKPNVQAVVGESWLMDTAFAKRAGFSVAKEEKEKMGGGFWGQFIDQDGQINEKRVDEFLNTGNPEYFVAKGYIKTEDLLKKYLPKEKRGIVTLVKPNDQYKKVRDEIKSASLEIKNIWSDSSFEDIKKIIESVSIIKDFSKNPVYKEFIDHVRETKLKNLKYNDTGDSKVGERFDAELDKFIKSNYFEEKRILIS